MFAVPLSPAAVARHVLNLPPKRARNPGGRQINGGIAGGIPAIALVLILR